MVADSVKLSEEKFHVILRQFCQGLRGATHCALKDQALLLLQCTVKRSLLCKAGTDEMHKHITS